MGALADGAFAFEGLREAWADVLANDADDGELSAGVARFEADLDDNLGRLAADLAWGAYTPADLTQVTLEGSGRALQIPPARDRVVERAILTAITPFADPALGPASYAYRPGLGVTDAVQAVAALREEGLGVVLRADIDDCFPSIPVGLARRKLGALVPDEGILVVVDALLARACRDKRGRRRSVRGLAQGSPLSPLLANLVLADIDSAVLQAGFSVVRYADDMVVAAETTEDAWEVARLLSTELEVHDMQLGSEDTQVMSFEEGFTFLGEDFGPRYPPIAPDARVVEPDRRVLYCATQGGRVRIQDGQLIVESPDDERLLVVPTSHLARVVCFGSVGVSAGARTWALANGIDIVFASRRGNYLGAAYAGASLAHSSRLRAQVRFPETPAAVELGRAIVEAKVRKQIVVLQRFGRRSHAEAVRDAVHQMQELLRMIPSARTTPEIMGLEGAAAAAYFPAYGSLFPEDLQFTNRSRQPPLDIANAALSFLYTILLGECVSALAAAGLEPTLGVLHADDEHRPSLALDLLEEFRPLVVDQVVLSSARHGRLTATHGRSEEGRAGVLLTRAGREAVLDGYELRMLSMTRGALPDFAGSLRRHLYRQAQRVAADVASASCAWTGLSWR